MYFNIKDQYRMKFYQLPKVFFTNAKYKTMSNDAKIAWAILADRMNLSIKNNWYDDQGNIYFIYTNKELQEILQFSEKTIIKIKNELIEADLFDQHRRGLNLANRLYLRQPEVEESDIYKIASEESGSGEEETKTRPKPLGDKELPKGKFQKLQKDSSGTAKSTVLKQEKVQPNDTDLKDTDLKDTELEKDLSIYPSKIEELNQLDLPIKVKQVLKKHLDRIIQENITLIDIDLAYHSNINDLTDHDFCVVLNNSLRKTKGKIQDITNLLTTAIEKYYIDVVHAREAVTEEQGTYPAGKSPGNNWLEGYHKEDPPLQV